LAVKRRPYVLIVVGDTPGEAWRCALEVEQRAYRYGCVRGTIGRPLWVQAGKWSCWVEVWLPSGRASAGIGERVFLPNYGKRPAASDSRARTKRVGSQASF